MKAEDCVSLHKDLSRQPDLPVSLDASGVERLGGQTVQVIVAHIRLRSMRDINMVISAPSPAFLATFATLGLTQVVQDAMQ
ncbi:hypothetical protein SAMN05444714_1848 [Yoonia litorea]|uniref:STAS domain-containing protein n=2 Tax=Yoonia litorea TaxID=1123755 RepID=A0A1I6MIA3_9RHOB|nr:hypothetical protein SAMN05444714_1848 [Yoonia litorea]